MERLNTESSRTWAPLKDSRRLARIHEALSLEPSSRDDFSIATELSLTTEMVGPPIPWFIRQRTVWAIRAS
jgi:hypothetical protein